MKDVRKRGSGNTFVHSRGVRSLPFANIACMIALLVGVAGYRVGTLSGAGRAALAVPQQRAAALVMQEDGQSPAAPEAAKELEPEPEPAYGTEAYFAKEKAKKGIAAAPERDSRGGFFQIFGGESGPEPPPATTVAEAFPNVLSPEERKVLIPAMKANGLTNFGAPFAKPDTSWDAVRSSQPLLAERSDKELYDAYMEQTTFKGFGSLFSRD